MSTKKKLLDSRVRDLIENAQKTNERALFVMVGDRSRYQLPTLHMIQTQSAENKITKKICWAYKKDLGFTTHGGKREKKKKKEIKQGKRDPNHADPFELFLTTQKIEYVYYKESERILGNTFSMLILQDFEALTPNTLARTIETVEGGGIVVLMLKSMSSLKQLYTMSMDIYSRYRTEAHADVVGRFNERFLLSLRDLDKNSLIIDDEMNVLPALGERNIKRLPPREDEQSPNQRELDEIKVSLEGVQPAQTLVSLSKTADQGKAILQFIDSIAEKTLRSTVALTAGRGRGKSAALGVAIAAAVAHGYSNIFITSPSPENLKTLFEFVFKGLEELNYSEGHDYDIFKSTNPAFNNSVVRVNVFKSHRQTIQYIDPKDAHVLGQAELVVIDEAAAIPLPLVRKLLGPYLVFMASTINGYEGTGRSLSLKLIKQLREQSSQNLSNRSLKEISLDEPIRYAPGDKIEQWLNDLLCLRATASKPKAFPPTNECDLWYVNRDSLFSYNSTSERILHKIWALFVSSHYKNSPNDLQLLSDAPAHQLFVLFAKPQDGKIPEPLCVVQVVLEGEISKRSIASSLSAGKRGDGDLIPWTVSQQFQDTEFATLSGARVLRIATHPDLQGMGYGKRALELLKAYYAGQTVDLNETNPDEMITRVSDRELAKASLATEELRPRSKLPSLFQSLSERPAERLDYIGVSYGLSPPLLKFWRKGGFTPVYLRQTTNDLTGEHTCIMLHVLEGREESWLGEFAADFKKRFVQLLAFSFKEFPSSMALNVLQSSDEAAAGKNQGKLTKKDMDEMFSPFDLKRLESYAQNALDYHAIMDMLPDVCRLLFNHRLDLESSLQKMLLLGIGLQKKTIEDMAKENKDMPVSQALGIFGKSIKRIASTFDTVNKEAINAELPAVRDEQLDEVNGVVRKIDTGDFAPPQEESEDEEENEDDEENEKQKELKEKQKEMINSLDLSKFAIPGEWDDQAAQKAVKSSGKMSVKSDKPRKRKEDASEIVEQEMNNARKKYKKSKK